VSFPSMTQVRVRRVHAGPDASDGKRVLAGRPWPPGLATDAAHGVRTRRAAPWW
jgi:uncharacterized protein YeaO (DUF488 family)